MSHPQAIHRSFPSRHTAHVQSCLQQCSGSVRRLAGQDPLVLTSHEVAQSNLVASEDIGSENAILLIIEFPDVLHDHLNPIPMRTDSMHIYLKEMDEHSLQISTAWQIRKHFNLLLNVASKIFWKKVLLRGYSFPLAGVHHPFSFQREIT